MEALILGCSAAKRKDGGQIPAVLRYDGPLFKVLRKQPPNIDAVFILSARYGIIAAAALIPDYNQRMKIQFNNTEWTAWREQNVLRPALKIAEEYETIALCMGNDYYTALGIDEFTRHVAASGGRVLRLPPGRQPIGKMAAALKNYCLERRQPDTLPVWWPE